MPRYDFKRIESRWQAHWEAEQTFKTEMVPGKPKIYILDMFPYPSGDGLHVGHPEGYTATDILCRYYRTRGKNVLHPMGWDAFGLPAEQHAIKTGTHPRVTTYKNIDTFRRQLKMLGFSYDWSRELSTTDPDYFRWTQWIFLELFDTWYDPHCEWTGQDGVKRTGRGRPIAELPIPDDVRQQGSEAVRRYQDKHRLAYQQEAPVNWCPALGTVLANEEVIDGKSERGSHPVVRIPLRQWMLRITAYADRLLADLEGVNWSESIKHLQKNWIGRSEGAEVDFFVPQLALRDTLVTAPSSKGLEAFHKWRMQRAQSSFPGDQTQDCIRVYTTRPDTLYGVTYMVLAPEHPFVDRLTTPQQKSAVEAYRQQSSTKSDLDRTDLAKDKSGVFTGSYAINPVNGKNIPIWIADYVLMSYGTGAIMAVPAHDLRDWEFAVKFQIPILQVVEPPSGYEPTREERDLAIKPATDSDELLYPFGGMGTAMQSGPYDGLPTAEFKSRITADLTQKGIGRMAVNYRLRDWLFSRQHFWGEPFPIWHELDANGQPTGLMRTDPFADLPIKLPENFEFKPHGRPEPPLEEAGDDWLYRTADDGVRLKRESNSMPQWAGSCWYYLRFADPKNSERMIDPEVEKYWLPVDVYIGGAEHAVLHLLYARFWHKVLFDRGHVSSVEPFHKLVNQGMILGEMEFTGYQPAGSNNESSPVVADLSKLISAKRVKDEVDTVSKQPVHGIKVNPDDVEKVGDDFVLKANPTIAVEARSYKMSKSRGNVINPDAVVTEYGADSLRLYEMFMGPLEATKPWSMQGVEGVHRFLGRVWRLIVDDKADDVQLNSTVQPVEPTVEQTRLLHKTIKAVTDDIEKLSFNTAISRMMEFTNEIGPQEVRPVAVLKPFVQLLGPFAPHVAEELWHALGNANSLAYEPWPTFDESLLVETEVEIPVQVNGKVRATVRVPVDADQAAMQQLASKSETISKLLEGKTIVKCIVIPGRLVNFVVK
ncbi:MAG: leucine--tRNA ligase [Planctomycetaceae bacterium]